jgi:putative lipoprotein
LIKRFCFFLFLSFLCVSLAVTGYDKFLHYSVSYTAYGFSSFLLGNVGGFLFTSALGIGKEIWDFTSRRGTAEFEDLIADFAGMIAAYHHIRSLDFRPFFIFQVVF